MNTADKETVKAGKKAPVASSKKTGNQRHYTPPKLKLLVSVVEREKADLYLALIQGFEVNMQLSMAAHGTASTETLRYLGLSDSNKAVIFSIIREDRVEAALRYLENKFQTIKNGKGIAFTVPVSSVIGVAIYQFLSNQSKKETSI